MENFHDIEIGNDIIGVTWKPRQQKEKYKYKI